MTIQELITELSKVEDKQKEVFVLDQGSGYHLSIRRIEFDTEEGDGSNEYPLLVPEN